MIRLIYEGEGIRLEQSTRHDLWFVRVNGIFHKEFYSEEAARKYVETLKARRAAPIKKLD